MTHGAADPPRPSPAGPAGIEAHAQGADHSAASAAAAPARSAAHQDEANRILHALPSADYDHLLRHLAPLRLRLGDWLARAHEPIRHVYFVREGLVSILATEQANADVEIGTIGCEGLVGLNVVMGVEAMPFGAMVQIEGTAWRMSVEAFRRVLETHPEVRRLALRYAQVFLESLAQTAACNRLHSLDERLARWLLVSHDSVRGDEFDLTHEALSLMLGVRRAGVSEAMGALQADGVLRSSRGRIRILDRPRLEERSCPCHAIVAAARDRLIA
jgi:CRP-like cAMP-binding protein